MEIITKSPKATAALGTQLAAAVKPIRGARFNESKTRREDTAALVIGLRGELGSGKTVFVQGFARGLGFTGRVLSPTYIIVRRYELQNSFFSTLYHIDGYRLQSKQELSELGLEEIMTDAGAVAVVEWIDRFPRLHKHARIRLEFKTTRPNTRRISVSAVDAFDHILSQLSE